MIARSAAPSVGYPAAVAEGCDDRPAFVPAGSIGLSAVIAVHPKPDVQSFVSAAAASRSDVKLNKSASCGLE